VKRALAVLAVTLAGFVGLGVLMAPVAQAHPLGNFTVNRYSGLLLSPGRIQVTYVLDMAEIPTFQEMPNIDTNGDGTASPAERQAWAGRTAPAIARRLTLTVRGRPVQLTLDQDAMRFRRGQGGLPILYFRAVFDGSIPDGGAVRYRDANFADRIGWKEITASSEDGVALAGSNVPATSVSHELLAYPVSLLSSPLRATSASFSFRPGQPAEAIGAPTPSGGTVTGAPITSGGGFAALVGWQLTPLVLFVSLLLAFGFGALHALGPGHGKTITAAYLVGKGAKVRQAAVAGAAVSFMHTASVLALGLVALVLFHSFPADRVYPWLGFLTGVVALGLGSALLMIRVRTRRRGTDPWRGHSHSFEPVVVAPKLELVLAGVGAGTVDSPLRMGPHDDHHPYRHVHHHDGNGHGHEHSASESGISKRGLAALAVSGGILPSPSALVVLTGAIAYHRIAYGLGLILAFSAGLATALMVVAVLALRARSLVADRLGSRIGSILPIVSAAVIIVFGLFFAARGLMQV
jgi:ABC-type nickel/cobalt efflux system permease component RcnA